LTEDQDKVLERISWITRRKEIQLLRAEYKLVIKTKKIYRLILEPDENHFYRKKEVGREFIATISDDELNRILLTFGTLQGTFNRMFLLAKYLLIENPFK
jgi:hypothetical protein